MSHSLERSPSARYGMPITTPSMRRPSIKDHSAAACDVKREGLLPVCRSGLSAQLQLPPRGGTWFSLLLTTCWRSRTPYLCTPRSGEVRTARPECRAPISIASSRSKPTNRPSADRGGAGAAMPCPPQSEFCYSCSFIYK
eukprot:scaffold213560_cov43-Tisochrysis_lutea.AAC.1